jgi:hypothetical protein
MTNSSNNAVETDDLIQVNSVIGTDFVVITANVSGNLKTRNVSVDNLFANITHDVKAANVTLTFKSTPSNSIVNCVMGQYWFDNNYGYYAVANNQLKRWALETF